MKPDWSSRTKLFLIEIASILSLVIVLFWMLWHEWGYFFHPDH